MTLTLSDGKLYYELMLKLQQYVNQKRGFNMDMSSFEEFAKLPTEEKLKVRDELWNDPKLIDSYVEENPDALPSAELEIIGKWKDFVKGSFFIFRHLKKGSIFIKEEQVYSVHGIFDPLDEIVPSYALPQMVETVLLPFKGQIIYDGLLSGYRVHFGGGIRSGLNRTYTVAKHKERIIATLEPDLAPPVSVKSRKDALPKLEELSAAIVKLKSDSPLQKSALALAQASLEVSIADAEGVITPDEADRQANKIQRTANRLLKLLDMESQ